jgi:hypothetical protein
VYNWFKNYAKTTENGEDTDNEEDDWPLPLGDNKFGKVYKARDAATVLHSEVIQEKLASQTSDVPGSVGYLKLYPGVLSEVIDGLSKKERQVLEETAENWNKRGAPEALKKRQGAICPYCIIELTFG